VTLGIIASDKWWFYQADWLSVTGTKVLYDGARRSSSAPSINRDACAIFVPRSGINQSASESVDIGVSLIRLRGRDTDPTETNVINRSVLHR
jgi:hypothetical protein